MFMTRDQVKDAVDHLEREGTRITYATVLAHLGGGSKRDLAALLPGVRPQLDEGPQAVPEDSQVPEDPPTPPEVLSHFRAAHATLSAQLLTLKQSNDVASLDVLAIVQVKLTHIETRLPALESEAQVFEHAAHMDRVALRNRPLWTEAARAKCEARDGIVAACETLIQCLDKYRKAHTSQVGVIVHVPWPAPQRATYTSLPASLVQVVQVVCSGTPDARQWLERVRNFDEIGCHTTMPSGDERL